MAFKRHWYALLACLAALPALAAQHPIVLGTTINDHTGDSLFIAGGKINTDFAAAFGWAISCASPLTGCGVVSSGLSLSLLTIPVSLGGTSFTSYTKGDLLCASSSSALAKLAVGSDGKLLTANSGASCGLDWETLSLPTIAETGGGTGKTGYTKGDLLCASSSSSLVKLGVGTSTQVLTANPTATCGVDWETPSGGGGGGGGSGLPSGTPLIVGVALDTPNSNWSNFTMGVELKGHNLVNISSAWKFNWVSTTGPTDIDHCVVRRTATGTILFLDSTTVLWSGSASATLAQGETYSDEITVPIDTAHDTYILCFLATTTNNTNVSLGQASVVGGLAGSRVGGDQTATTNATPAAITTNPIGIGSVITF